MSKKASSKGSGEDHELMLERKARFYKNYLKACKPLNVTPSKTLKDLIHKSEEEGGSGDGYRHRGVRAKGAPPCPRYCHASAISKDQMFIFGDGT